MVRLIAAVGLLAACQAGIVNTPPTGPAGVTLTTTQATYRAGAEVELRLTNSGSGDVGYNLCTSGLQRLSGSTWSAVAEDRICTMELRLLQPGASADYRIRLPSNLAAGQYRYTTSLEQMQSGSRSAAFSNSFTVLP